MNNQTYFRSQERQPRVEGRVSSVEPVSRFTFHVSRITHHASRSIGFTLIELLVVIAVIAILAALVIPITGAVNAARTKARARTELTEIETAIERYKAKLGHYPPDNPGNAVLNQLYYELSGTTLSNGVYTTLDGSTQLPQPLLQAGAF